MAITIQIVLTAYRPYAGQNGAPVISDGGTFQIGTYSFLLVALYTGTVDSSIMGYPLTVPSQWQNVSITINNKKVTLAWTWPAGLPRPASFRLYHMMYSSWFFANPGTAALCGGSADVAGTLNAATWDAPGSAQQTFSAAYPAITLSPIVQPGASADMQPVIAADLSGHAYLQSFPFVSRLLPDASASVWSPISRLTLPVMRISVSQADLIKLLYWRDQGMHAVAYDAGTNYDARYKYYVGAIEAIDYLGMNAKGESQRFVITMKVSGVGLV